MVDCISAAIKCYNTKKWSITHVLSEFTYKVIKLAHNGNINRNTSNRNTKYILLNKDS